jgi:uncharacterized protein with beta-barrel porin domain
LTFSGAIANTGTITGTGGTAIDVSAANNAITIDQQAGLISGATKLSPNADVLNISGGTINGNIVGLGSGDTINFALGSGNTFTYGSNFTGINQVNINSGTVVLNGVDTATNFAVNGGTLAGTGTLNVTAATTLAVNSGGTFSPGTPGIPGTFMTVNGNLAFQSGAFYAVVLNPTTSSSANVSGTASLAGTASATFLTGSYMSKVYTILSAGSVTGTFGALTTTNLPTNFSASLAYDSAHAYLDLTLSFTPPPTTPSYTPLNVNESNVAATLIDYFNTTGGIPTKFGTLSSDGLMAVDGEDATGAERGAFQMMDQFLGLLLDPFVDGRSGAGWLGGGSATARSFAPEQDAGLPPDIALAYTGALKAPPQPASIDQRWTTWGAGFGGTDTANGNAVIGSTNVTVSDYGYAGGLDYHLSPDSVVGFGLAGGGTNWGLEQGLGTGRSDDFHAGVYGTTRAGPWYFAGALALAEHWMSTDRFALGDQLAASFNAQSYGGRLEAGYRYTTLAGAAPLGVTPYAALQVADFHTPTYSEADLTGGGFGLSYNAMSSTDTRSELGSRFDELTVLNGMPVTLQARLAWTHDWVSNPALDAVFETLPGTNFVVYGAPLPKDSALTSAGAVWRINPALSFSVKFDGEFAGSSQSYAGSGTLRYAW